MPLLPGEVDDEGHTDPMGQHAQMMGGQAGPRRRRPHVRSLPALTISGQHDDHDGTNHVSSQMSMPGDEEELKREYVQQRGVETMLEDGGVVLEDSGVPIAFTVTGKDIPSAGGGHRRRRPFSLGVPAHFYRPLPKCIWASLVSG
jgi:hypothetical protein